MTIVNDVENPLGIVVHAIEWWIFVNVIKK
jgi:hypothetical protein